MAQQVPEGRDFVTLQLTRPIQLGTTGERHESIHVCKPRGAEMRLMPTKPETVGAMHPMLAKLCRLTVAEFELLELEDYLAVQKLVGDWVEQFPKTGPSASDSSPGTSGSGETSSST